MSHCITSEKTHLSTDDESLSEEQLSRVVWELTDGPGYAVLSNVFEAEPVEASLQLLLQNFRERNGLTKGDIREYEKQR